MSDTREGLKLIGSERAKRGDGAAPTVSRPPEYSDMGNAKRFAKQHSDDVRYCGELAHQPCGGWLVWQPTGTPAAFIGPASIVQSGGYWRPDDTGQVMRFAKLTTESIKTENDHYATVVDVAAQVAHYFASQAKGKLSAMIALAESELPIPCTLKEFDTNPLLFNVLNGTINLATGEFYAARREDLMMKQAPVAFDPAAKCETWLTALQRMFARDPAAWQTTADEELMSYTARAVGYFLTGLAREKAVFLFYGPPSTGKGTFVETILALMGEDYAIVTATESVMDSKGFAQHPADLKAMQNRRLVVATETGTRLNVNKIKQITGGGDTMAGRGMRQDWGQLKPTWKLLLQTNEYPSTSDAGFYDRLNLVPFDSVVPKREQQTDLKELLQLELSGILNWALAGLKDYHAKGLQPPDRMALARATMRAEVDDTTRFRTECVDLGPTLKVGREVLYQKYKWWMEFIEMVPVNSRTVLSKKKFGSLMLAAEFKLGHSGPAWHWIGLDVKDAAQHTLSEARLRAESDRVAEENDLFKK